MRRAFAVAGNVLPEDRVGANLPTPPLGVWERINIGAFLLWVMVLAACLLREPAERQAPGGGTKLPAV